MGTESALAFEKLGCRVVHEKLIVTKAGSVLWDPVTILKRVIEDKPDLFFTVNVFGLDPAGDLLRALSLLKIKSALWFIDNPFYYHDHLMAMKSLPNVHSFVWDRFYLQPMSAFGIPHVHHLPQATNPDRFFERAL